MQQALTGASVLDARLGGCVGISNGGLSSRVVPGESDHVAIGGNNSGPNRFPAVPGEGDRDPSLGRCGEPSALQPRRML